MTPTRHRPRLLGALALVLSQSLGQPLHARESDADDTTTRVFIFAGQSNMVGSDSKVKDIQRFPPFAGLDQPQKKVFGVSALRGSDPW